MNLNFNLLPVFILAVAVILIVGAILGLGVSWGFSS